MGLAMTFLDRGFRPFFLAAGLWAAVAVALWLPLLKGELYLATAFAPVAWHAHEMIFGFAVAAVAGFLLTAIPNWTGRPPVAGMALAALALLWLAGRLAVLASAAIGPLPAAAVDLAFLAALAAVVAREIVASGNWRNLPISSGLLILLAANALMHLEALGWAATAALGQRLGLAVLLMLISLIGGRIVPAFTRNWLAARGATRLPAPFGTLDKAQLATTLAALLGWVAAPEARPVGLLLLAAALLGAARLSRWRGAATLPEALLAILHVGYGWLVLGLALLGAALLTPAVPATAALHALSAGAVGTMTLAVMTRASLGHSGRALAADGATRLVYGLVTGAALLRVAAPFLDELYLGLLAASSGLWIGAFALFVVSYLPIVSGWPSAGRSTAA